MYGLDFNDILFKISFKKKCDQISVMLEMNNGHDGNIDRLLTELYFLNLFIYLYYLFIYLFI